MDNQTKSSKLHLKVLILPLLSLFVAFLMIPIPYYIEMPGTTENLKAFVQVNHQEDTEAGDFYLTTVTIRQATPYLAFRAWLSDFQEVVSEKELFGESTDEEYDQMQQYFMDASKNAAIEQALKLADLPYEMTFKGVYVLSLEENSNFSQQLSVGDTITAIDGHTFETSEDFIDYVKKQKIGQQVRITYTHEKEQKEASGELIKLKTDKKAGIGIGLTDHTDITPSVPIEINTEDIGGPSAGLMFTLETYEQLTKKNLRKGKQIAGTGTMNADGTVGRIGGIDKKVVTASEHGIEIFFAPDDEITKEMKEAYPEIQSNYKEAQAAAKKINTKMKIVPVKTVEDAIRYLENMKT